jgi:hypothetical protein
MLGQMKGYIPAVPYSVVYAPAGSIKAIGEYRLRIRGIVRGGKDLVGDTFTRQTDLGFKRSPLGMPVYYDHAQRGIKNQVGEVVGWDDAGDGIDFMVELDRALRYADEIMRLHAAKALGASTGALGHLVVREAGILKRWIVGELSLTPTPAEPRTRPTKALSSAALLHAVKYELDRQTFQLEMKMMTSAFLMTLAKEKRR